VGGLCAPQEGTDEIGDLAKLGMDNAFVKESFLDAEVNFVNECALTAQDEKCGDHVCPITDREAAQTFSKQKVLEKVLFECKDLLMDIFDLCEDDIRGANGLVCAVSQPSKDDCPLIYVSDGFEKLTGYPGAFGLGRSCRFLQPTVACLNDAINLKDRKGLREFCADYKSLSHGQEIVNLLLNERYDGLRFWNLLNMAYVEVEGEKYIFAVQTPLAAYMPKALRGRVNGETKNRQIVTALPVFAKRLNDLRDGLAERTGESIFELAVFASQYLDQMEKKTGSQKMCKVKSMSAISDMKAKVGGRKMNGCPSVKNDQLALRFLSVTGLTTPVPNKDIPVLSGQSVQVNVDNPAYTAMFAVLSSEQYAKVQPIVICLDLIPRADGAPMLMCTVKRAMADNKGVRIDGEEALPGTSKAIQVGSFIDFGDAFTLRVASLKSKIAMARQISKS
jgi:hypothetical protein